MTTVNECYLCKGTAFNKKPGSVRDRPELNIFECISCGLVFLSSFDHIADDFYENSKMYDKKRPDIEARLKEAAWDDERRFQFLKPLLPTSRLLDFGCEAGGFLMMARKLVEIAHGVELETCLKSHYQKNALTIFYNISEIPENVRGTKYDIITMFHVLEHIPDPKKILYELSEMLTDKGQIIMEVPNADDALLTLYKNEPFSHYNYWSCHLYMFTSKTIKMLFSQINLKVNYIKQIQRHPLSNHLYWLANGKPGGHKKWHFLDSPDLHASYEKHLATIGKCDTILASISRY